MKIIKSYQILILCSLTLLSFSSKNRTYQTQCVTIETDGYIIIKIWDTKKGSHYKAENARKDAVNAILYSGIAGNKGCSTQLPILNKAEEQEEFKSIEKSFFTRNGKWSTYSRSAAAETTLPLRLGEKNWKVYQVSVSINQLRKYLEGKKIIKPLTNGF